VNAKSYKVGAIKAVVFCDEVCVRRVLASAGFQAFAVPQTTLACSTGYHAPVSSLGVSGSEWIGIVCDSRVFLYDIMTHKVSCPFWFVDR
jgi:hypothetical protein